MEQPPQWSHAQQPVVHGHIHGQVSGDHSSCLVPEHMLEVAGKHKQGLSHTHAHTQVQLNHFHTPVFDFRYLAQPLSRLAWALSLGSEFPSFQLSLNKIIKLFLHLA